MPKKELSVLEIPLPPKPVKEKAAQQAKEQASLLDHPLSAHSSVKAHPPVSLAKDKEVIKEMAALKNLFAKPGQKQGTSLEPLAIPRPETSQEPKKPAEEPIIHKQQTHHLKPVPRTKPKKLGIKSKPRHKLKHKPILTRIKHHLSKHISIQLKHPKPKTLKPKQSAKELKQKLKHEKLRKQEELKLKHEELLKLKQEKLLKKQQEKLKLTQEELRKKQESLKLKQEKLLKQQQEKLKLTQERLKEKQTLKKQKSLKQKLQEKLRQGLLRKNILESIKASDIYLGRKKIEKAKHLYSKALLYYFQLPVHEEEMHLTLKSLLKKIEKAELQPHWSFHRASHKLLHLKKEKKEVSKEALEAIQSLNTALSSKPEIAIPKIQLEQAKPKPIPPFFQPEKAPQQEEFHPQFTISQAPEQKQLRISKTYEQVQLTQDQKEIMKKLQKLRAEKQKLRDELEQVS